VRLTGYHRKHAIRVLNCSAAKPVERRPRDRIYDDAVRQALIILWEAADRICSKRLKAAQPLLIVAIEHHGHLALDAGVRRRLLAMSAATIDRLGILGRHAHLVVHREPTAAPAEHAAAQFLGQRVLAHEKRQHCAPKALEGWSPPRAQTTASTASPRTATILRVRAKNPLIADQVATTLARPT